MSLSANQERAEMEKKRLVWKVQGSSGETPKVARGRPVDPKIGGGACSNGNSYLRRRVWSWPHFLEENI